MDRRAAGGTIAGCAIVPHAGAARVYMAIAGLRKRGLRDLLVTVEPGYLLDPDVAVERVGPPTDG